MSEPLRAIIAQNQRRKPPAPGGTQVLACPAGYVGSGEYQSRSVTWNVPTQSWVVGDWVTTNFDCRIASYLFVGPWASVTVRQVDTGEIDDSGQPIFQFYGDYGPYAISNGPYVCTMFTEFNRGPSSPPWNGHGEIIASISIPGAGGMFAQLTWDRDYSSWPKIQLDANGNFNFGIQPSDDGAQEGNVTQFTVLLTGS